MAGSKELPSCSQPIVIDPPGCASGCRGARGSPTATLTVFGEWDGSFWEVPPQPAMYSAPDPQTGAPQQIPPRDSRWVAVVIWGVAVFQLSKYGFDNRESLQLSARPDKGVRADLVGGT